MSHLNTFKLEVNSYGKPELYIDGLKLKGVIGFKLNDRVDELPSLSIEMVIEYDRGGNNEPS